jgi:hypothetical protein
MANHPNSKTENMIAPVARNTAWKCPVMISNVLQTETPMVPPSNRAVTAIPPS